jgi:hypothetical protein
MKIIPLEKRDGGMGQKRGGTFGVMHKLLMPWLNTQDPQRHLLIQGPVCSAKPELALAPKATGPQLLQAYSHPT